MGGKACIRGMRITVASILGLLSENTPQEILGLYPYLEKEDIEQALSYASWRMEEYEEPLLLNEA